MEEVRTEDIEDAEAARLTGWRYLELDNTVEGVHHLNKALDMGSVDALVDVGSFYDSGEHSFPVDKNKALEHYTRACTLGDREGCRFMGLLLQEMGEELAPHIKEHVGYMRFYKTMIGGNLFNFLGFILSGKCWEARKLNRKSK